MKLDTEFDVEPSKIEALKQRIKTLGINASEIEESFIKGGGKGGQKINKTANAVQLTYPPFHITVKVQQERRRNLNRYLALRELVDRVEMKVRPDLSKRMKGWEKIRKRKARRKRRFLKKIIEPASN